MDPVKTFKDLEKHFAAVAPERRIAVVCPSDDHTREVVERCLNEFGSRFTLCCCDSPEWADSLASANPDAINVIRCGNADEAARLDAVSKFFDFFYDCERYSDYMVYEGFLPATTDSSDYLASNAEKHKVGGSDATGNSEYFKNFCGLLPNCQFYPMSKAEWMDVRNGVTEFEQQVCQGSISAQEALDNLQNSIAG